MKLIRLEEARPGNRLAKDVTDLRGNLLYKGGIELALDHIEKIKARNVTHIFVEEAGVSGGMSAEDVVKREMDIDSDIDKAFADVASAPFMIELRDAAKRYLKSRLK